MGYWGATNVFSDLQRLARYRREVDYSHGALGSTMVGLGPPSGGILFGEAMGLFGKDDNSIQNEKDFFALLFIGLAFFTGIGSFIETFFFSIAGEQLVFKLRELSFKTILSKEIDWFDRPQNAVGSVCAQLYSDPSAIQGATGVRIGLLAQVVSNITASLVLSFYFSWKLSLASCFFIAVILLSTFFSVKQDAHTNIDVTEAMQSSARVIHESVSNIRSVASQGLEITMHTMSMKPLDDIRATFLRWCFKRGFIYALFMNSIKLTSTITYCYGGYLVQYENLSFKETLRIGETLLFGMRSAGLSLAFTKNYSRAKSAMARISKFVHQEDQSNFCLQLTDGLNGKVSLDDIHFSYPSRPDVLVLRGFNASILPGWTVALVGPSGCGKSTCFQLLQRFYNPQRGTISVDDCNIAVIHRDMLRFQLGVVSQEPILFNRSIAENIAYGNEDLKMEDVISAALKANILPSSVLFRWATRPTWAKAGLSSVADRSSEWPSPGLYVATRESSYSTRLLLLWMPRVKRRSMKL